MKVDLKNMDLGEIEAWTEEEGFEAYRGRQIRQWLFKKYASSFDEMTNHQWLTKDRMVQRTEFSSGQAVIVNFGNEPYTSKDG